MALPVTTLFLLMSVDGKISTGAGLIYRWQGRLAPLVVSHVLVNLATTLPALILPIVLP